MISKNTCFEGTSLHQIESLEPLCVKIGSRVWAARREKSPLVLKLQKDLILFLFCETVSHLIKVTLLLTSPMLNSNISDRPYFNLSIFKVENPSISLFFSSSVCIHLGYIGYLRTDISGFDQADHCFIACSIRNHSPSFHSGRILFYFTCLYICHLFILCRHYKAPSFHTVIRIHIISSPSHTCIFAPNMKSIGN